MENFAASSSTHNVTDFPILVLIFLLKFTVLLHSFLFLFGSLFSLLSSSIFRAPFSFEHEKIANIFVVVVAVVGLYRWFGAGWTFSSWSGGKYKVENEIPPFPQKKLQFIDFWLRLSIYGFSYSPKHRWINNCARRQPFFIPALASKLSAIVFIVLIVLKVGFVWWWLCFLTKALINF